MSNWTTALELAATAFAGALIGLFYFGGLWLTINHALGHRRAALLVSASFLARAFLAAAAFVVVASGSWMRLLACLVGFVVTRYALARRLGPAKASDSDRSR